MRVKYAINSPQVRTVLLRAGQEFSVSLNAQGVAEFPAATAFREPVLRRVILDTENAAHGDIDGDGLLDSAVVLYIDSSAGSFADVAIVRNAGEGRGVHAGGYAFGKNVRVDRLDAGEPGWLTIIGHTVRPDGERGDVKSVRVAVRQPSPMQAETLHSSVNP